MFFYLQSKLAFPSSLFFDSVSNGGISESKWLELMILTWLKMFDFPTNDRAENHHPSIFTFSSWINKENSFLFSFPGIISWTE